MASLFFERLAPNPLHEDHISPVESLTTFCEISILVCFDSLKSSFMVRTTSDFGVLASSELNNALSVSPAWVRVFFRFRPRRGIILLNE